MFSLLIVDDEEYAVVGLSQGIDWQSIGIEHLYVAYSAQEAWSILQHNRIDILITDIEMGDNSGLDLVQWVNEYQRDVEVIFLTAHAQFHYAKEAVRLGGAEYLLKPVDFETLLSVIDSIIKELKKAAEHRIDSEMYMKFYKMWSSHRSELLERFWFEVFNGRIPPTPQRFQPVIELYQLPVAPDGQLLLFMISVEDWGKELGERDEAIMEYALHNIAEEVLLDGLLGDIIKELNGPLLGFIYIGNMSGTETRRKIERNCTKYIDACSKHFRCKLSVYVGLSSDIAGIVTIHQRLHEMERNNIQAKHQVILMEEIDNEQRLSVVSDNMRVPWFPDWFSLLDSGQVDLFLHNLDKALAVLEQASYASAEVLELFHNGLCYTFSYYCFKNHISMPTSSSGEPLSLVKPKNIAQLKRWAAQFVHIVRPDCMYADNANSTIIRNIHQFIDDHYSEPIKREDIAGHVFLNAAYLSRLYKKETGRTLFEYLLYRRIEAAKELIRGTDLKLSEVAERIGMPNESYFRKVFRRLTGQSPSEFKLPRESQG